MSIPIQRSRYDLLAIFFNLSLVMIFNYPTSKVDIPISTPRRTVPVTLSNLTAQIVEVREHHETKVTSSGGGGWVSNGSGYIAPPAIKSQTVRVERIWLQTPGTRERCETFRNSPLEPRVGQYLTTVFDSNQTVLYRYNHGNGKFEYSDKQVRSYLRGHVPLDEFVKAVAFAKAMPSMMTVLVVLILLGLVSKVFAPLTAFSLIMTRLVTLAVLLPLLLLVRERVFGSRDRDQAISAAMLELKKAIQSISIP